MANFGLRQSIIELEAAKSLASSTLLNFTLTNNARGFNFSGILKNKPKFTISAEYDRLINFDQAFATINKIGYFAGKSFGTSQTWTRKIFKGGSYLGVSLQTRIVAGEKGQSVISRARELASLCSPNSLSDDGNISTTLKQGQQKIIEAKGAETQLSKKENKDLTIDDSESVWGNLKGLLEGSINNSPPRLHLKISNYFSMSRFYAKSVEWEFSHEQTIDGPLYADINIELENIDIRKSTDIKDAFTLNSNFDIEVEGKK